MAGTTERSDEYLQVRKLANDELWFALSLALSTGTWHVAYFQVLDVTNGPLNGIPILDGVEEGWDD